jgi:PAS domain S-box-containing protein
MWWSALITQNKTNELTRVQHTQSEGPATVSPTGEDQFRLMVDEVHDYAIVMLDPDGRIVSWNKGAQRLKGYEEAEIIGEPMERLYPSEARTADKPRALLARAAAEGRVEDEGWRLRKDGTQFFANVVITAIHNSAGELIGFGKITRDITERRKIEEALHISEGLLRRAQHLAHMGSDIRDPRTGGRRWSDECYEIFGVPGDFVPTNESVLQLIHPDDRDKILAQRAQIAAGICPEPIEYRIVRPDRSIRYIRREWEIVRDEAGVAIQLLSAIHDITEHRQTEEQLRQAQKMEAIGNLTGGMAHDFNNLLAVIITNIDMAKELAGNDAELQELLGEANGAALRGADLTQRLLAFARRQPLRAQQIDINALTNMTATLLRRVLGENIEVSLNLGEVWPVNADPTQLEAGLTNLATNARDAMPRGGRLIFATGNRFLDDEYAAQHLDVTAGDYAMIEVTDTGSGMAPEVVEHIFEPFYTTKEQGRGTGLGLSMVFGFMKQSGGHISVYSEPGIGTTFRLYLPRVATITEPADASAGRAAAALQGSGETILIVEDNAALRRTVSRQLRLLGYNILESDRAAAALELLQQQHVDLLFTDVVTPGQIDGVELAHLAQERWPAIKVLLTSGFPQDRIDDPDLSTELPLLTKPYRTTDLAAALRTIFVP